MLYVAQLRMLTFYAQECSGNAESYAAHLQAACHEHSTPAVYLPVTRLTIIIHCADILSCSGGWRDAGKEGSLSRRSRIVAKALRPSHLGSCISWLRSTLLVRCLHS